MQTMRDDRFGPEGLLEAAGRFGDSRGVFSAMPKITYVSVAGDRVTVDAAVGDSLMSAAVQNGVPGIIGECGGCASCASCHVYIDPERQHEWAPPGEVERDMLELAVSDRREGSRLGCQVEVTADMDGLEVGTPASQTV